MIRGFALAAALFVSFAGKIALAQAETSNPPRTLSERLSQFRLGWTGDEEQSPATQGATNATTGRATTPRSTLSGGLPRTNSQSLLPGDLNSERGSAPAPPRVAALPDRYQRDNAGANATGTRYPSTSANRSTPTTRVRRSPFQSPKHEFDAAELRRDLVSTNAPSAGTAAGPTVQQQLNNPAAAGVTPARTHATISDRNSGKEVAQSQPVAQERIESLPATAAQTPAITSTQPTRLTPTIQPERLTTDNSRADTIEPVQPSTTSQADLRNLFQDKSTSSVAPPSLAASPAAMPVPGDLLMSQKMPQIVSHVSGPRQIVVGREVTYKLWIANRGELAADELATRIMVPAWAELKKVSVSTGALDRQEGSGEMKWNIAKLDAQKFETLEVVLVAKESRPIELGVDWTHAPVDSRTVVEVREPKLAMTVTGPDEVLFGKPQLYRLTLSNPGTAPAEELTIHLTPPGGDDSKTSSHAFGMLAAGESKTAEVELTAREAGKLFVKAGATAAGGLSVAAEKEIFCRKPELEVDWRGPEKKYAGTQATYYFRVRNPGTAPAEGVKFQVELPAGFEVTEASGGAGSQKDQKYVVWTLNALQPGDDHYLELKGTVHQPGANEFRFGAASADGSVIDTAAMTTQVEALADLKLQVSDPSGPVAVGEEAIYEIRVQNYGASEAKQVAVAALFSDGIEPQAAEGAGHEIADGRVGFHTIERIPAGESVTLRVRARGMAAGTHLFRAEVVCGELEIKLAAEESTRFFADEVSPIQTADQSTGVVPAEKSSRY